MSTEEEAEPGGFALDYPYKVQLGTPFTSTSLSPVVVVDGVPVGARTMWLTCSTGKADRTISSSGVQVRIRQNRGTGETWAVIDLGLFQGLCIDVSGSKWVRVEVVANQMAAVTNGIVSVVFSAIDRQNAAPSRAWSVVTTQAGAPVQQVPYGAVSVMSLAVGGDAGFVFALMDPTGAMVTYPVALNQSVPVDIRGTHFQPSANGNLAWLIQL